MSGIFVVQNLEDFAGDFLGKFFWALFPHKNEEKNPARKSATKSGGSKKKNLHKIRSAKSTLMPRITGVHLVL